jgi:DNA mismatch endonuclease, patch repair protein
LFPLDAKNVNLLHDKKWRILVIWECAVKGKTRLIFNDIIEKAESWIKFDNSSYCEIKGIQILNFNV